MKSAKYNPAFLDAEERQRRFGGRQHDLDELMRVLRENRMRGRNQHMLVVGPRGIGKTMLLLRAADSILSDPELSSVWFPVVASEESYHITSIGELWLEMVFHLARTTGDIRHEQAYEALREAHDDPRSSGGDRRLATAALGHLLDHADRVGRRLVLVIENLHMLFGEQMEDVDAWGLRETLVGEPRIMLLGSTVGAFHQIDSPIAPLFEQFLLHKLEPLDTDGCLDLWRRLNGDVVPSRRMRALQILTGGNPRLLVILAEFAGKLSLRELTRDLANLLDDHTDYLKMTTEALPALERKVFVSLAETWEYASAATVASLARVDLNTASAQLGRLAERGAVAWRRKGRGKQYRVAERLYSIYHLMRRRGGAAARARAVTEFMVAYYDGPALVEHLQSIAEEALALPPGKRMEHFLMLRSLLDSRALARGRVEALSRLPSGLAECPDAPDWLKQHLVPVSEPRDVLERIAGVRISKIDRSRLERLAMAETPPELQRLIDETRRSGKRRTLATCTAHAIALGMLGAAHINARQWQDAFRASSEAAHELQDLAQRRADLGVPLLATGLSQLANCQLELGQAEDALESITRSVRIYEELAAAHPEAFLVHLARNLNNLSVAQSKAGLGAEALASIARSVEIYERLAPTDGRAIASDYAGALLNLSNRQAAAGQLAGAIASLARGVEVLQELASADPKTFQPTLGVLLGALGPRQIEAGRQAEALASTSRAVELYEHLVAVDSGASWPALAGCLNNLSVLQAEFGQSESALANISRAVEIYEQVTRVEPDAPLARFAVALNNLANCQAALGNHTDALATSARAVDVWERMEAAQPGTFVRELARALGALAHRQQQVGKHADALAGMSRSVKMYEGLVAANADGVLPMLAACLTNLSFLEVAVGQHDQALVSVTRAVEIYTGLAATDRGEELPNLAIAFANLSHAQSHAGRHAEAATSALRAVENFGRLSEKDPQSYRPYLATASFNLARTLQDAGRGKEAIEPLHQATQVWRELCRARSEEHQSDLSRSLMLLGEMLTESGRFDEALSAYEEGINLDPSGVPFHTERGLLLASLERLDEAVSELAAVTSTTEDRESRIKGGVQLCGAIAASGRAQQALQTIQNSPMAPYLEPLIVALRKLIGEEVSPPVEIEEIADDLIEEILKASKTLGGSGNGVDMPSTGSRQ